MELNFIGLISAISAFLGIAFGHVGVRWLEYRVARLWMAMLAYSAAGLAMQIFSLVLNSLYLKSLCGIIGMTLLWDAVELIRQQRRVRRGHAPANPCNPRHRRFLEAPSSSATVVDRLADSFEPHSS
ncbi:MAG: hypothetical protein DDG59_09020 [Anaerolineae bacterium]|jgi:membrane associated rhomboid family serine protease|nr:MAG: hypothetical protein DDG59_09020 [Anaerolineae bacterium]